MSTTTEPSARLVSALRGGKDALSAQGLTKIKEMSGPRPLAFMRTALGAWCVVALAIWAASASQSIWITALAVVLIATRQNVLGLLVHEQTHQGLGGKYGDWIANVICGYPLLALSVDGYAQVHLAHHRDYFQPSDPDFIRKSGAEWATPKRGIELLKLFASDLLLLNTWRMVRGKQVKTPTLTFQRRNPTPRWLRPVLLLTLVLGLTWTDTWAQFALYWLLPLVAVLPMLVRWGALCEHEYNRPGADMLASTPLIFQSWWERLLVPNLNFGLHPYHHMFPGVSYSQLPAVHQVFEREGLVHPERVFLGGSAYMRFLFGGPQGEMGKAPQV